MGNRIYRLNDIPKPRPSSLDSINHRWPNVPYPMEYLAERRKKPIVAAQTAAAHVMNT
jgi:hypothetical protein